MRSHRALLLSTMLLVALATTGCFTKSAPPPAELAARIITSEHLNPNADGVPSPVVVRFYEMKSTAKFQNTDFFTLFDDDTGTLASDLITKDEFRFNPGESKTINRRLDPATRFIGVMAAYRDIEKAGWQAVSAITEHKLNAFTILLGRNEISISITESDGKAKNK